MTLFEQGSDHVYRDIHIHSAEIFYKLAAHLNATTWGNHFYCAKRAMQAFLWAKKDFPDWFPVEFFEKQMNDEFDEFTFWGIWDSDEAAYDDYVNRFEVEF